MYVVYHSPVRCEFRDLFVNWSDGSKMRGASFAPLGRKLKGRDKVDIQSTANTQYLYCTQVSEPAGFLTMHLGQELWGNEPCVLTKRAFRPIQAQAQRASAAAAGGGGDGVVIVTMAATKDRTDRTQVAAACSSKAPRDKKKTKHIVNSEEEEGTFSL